MSQNRHPFAAQETGDPTASRPGLHGQQHIQPQPLRTIRTSSSQSTLADSIRALREQTSSIDNITSPKSPRTFSDSLANRRKANNPIPLYKENQGVSTKLYLRDGFQPPLTPNSALSFALPSAIDSPGSSTIKFDARLSPSTANPLRNLPASPLNSTDKSKRSYGQLGNLVSTSSALGAVSPPISPGHDMPRNLSIDSTVSSLSSNNSHPARSTTSPSNIQSIKGDTTFDAAAFVAHAGSTDAALLQLWKEKQNATSHSAQLWRLVEKQRSMVLGLQRDLERALKEKERYRKKWKEREHSISANSEGGIEQIKQTPSGRSEMKGRLLPKDDLDKERISNQQPGQLRNNDQIVLRTTELSVPSSAQLKSDNGVHGSNALRQNLMHPTHFGQSSPLDYLSDQTSIEASPITSASLRNEGSLERTQTPLTEPTNVTDASPREADTNVFKMEKHRPANISIVNTKASPPPTETPPSAPSLAITNSTPTTIDPGSFPSPPKASFGGRRSIPAPLTLMQSNLSPTSQQMQLNAQSPIIAVRGEYVPDDVERGRRRTREDDDRIREAVAMREEEARSWSSKKSKSTSKGVEAAALTSSESAPASKLAETKIMAIPPSSRPSVGTDFTKKLAVKPAVNPASLLSPSISESSISSTAAQRSSYVPSLLSPGLPMSPRPGHRPANSPAPRHAKQQLSVSSNNFTVPASPRLPPSSSAEEPETSASLSPPQTTTTSTESVGFSSPSAIPEPLFANKSDPSISPAALSMQPDERNLPPPVMKVLPTSSVMEANAAASGSICNKFVCDQYPGLLLPPSALKLIDVRVFSSRLRPSRHSILIAKPLEEDPVFLLGIYSRSDGKQLWRLEKTIHALPSLHNRVKSFASFAGKLPDPTLFQGHAPAKIDARRAALNAYFDMLLDTPLSEDAAVVLCHFFSTDVLDAEPEATLAVQAGSNAAGTSTAKVETSKREGYLTKRGKNFGGWKARYFVLDGPDLKYYDDQAGPQVGVIRLVNAQIGKQSSGPSNHSPSGRDSEENQYRHAFLILEPKKRDSSAVVRHVLCAESDEERDAWVTALLSYVGSRGIKKSRDTSATKQQATDFAAFNSNSSNLAEPPSLAETVVTSKPIKSESKERSDRSPPDHTSKEDNELHRSLLSSILPDRKSSSPQPHSQSQDGTRSDIRDDQLKTLGVSYEQTIQAEAPIIGQTSYQKRASQLPAKGQKDVSISGPTNGAPIQNMEYWGLKTPTHVKEKKRSIFGFRGRITSELIVPSTPGMETRSTPRNVFGMPLAEAIECSQPAGVDDYLPAVVYRCIEYLRAQNAASEEGVFRLSGSSVTIKSLRERFSQEGDVKLLEEEYYDVHAVASLLKLYLRELPNSILSRELHLDFLKINDLTDHQKKVDICNVLVHRLPRANFSLLDNLCSLLLDVVDKSERNKMNVRNVGIVFAPTLNIPAWLISLFLTDYRAVFGMAIDEEKSPIQEIAYIPPAVSDSIRSPRHQLFSDLPTPAYNQSSFSNLSGFAPLSGPGKAHRTTMTPSSQQYPQHPSSIGLPTTSPAAGQQIQHGSAVGHTQQQRENARPVFHSGPQHSAMYNMPSKTNLEASYASLNMLTSPPVQPASLSIAPDSRRANRESAMMGMDHGLISQRQASASRGLHDAR